MPRSRRRVKEFRVGLKSGQGMYIIAATKGEALKIAHRQYNRRYHKVTRSKFDDRVEDVKVWRTSKL